MPQKKIIISGNSFFKTYDFEILPSKGLFRLPELTLHLNMIHNNDKQKKLFTPKNIFLLLSAKHSYIYQRQQQTLECILDTETDKIRDVRRLVDPYQRFEQQTGLCVMSTITTVDAQKNANRNVEFDLTTLLPDVNLVGSKNGFSSKILQFRKFSP